MMILLVAASLASYTYINVAAKTSGMSQNSNIALEAKEINPQAKEEKTKEVSLLPDVELAKFIARKAQEYLPVLSH